MSTEASSNRLLNRLSEPVLAVANPDLFRTNAFRVVGVPVSTTERELRKHLEKVEMAKKLGGAAALPVGPLPLDPPPDSDAIREAVQRLRDPERRLIEEFFWFWRTDSANGEEALSALTRKDIKSAVSQWMAEEDGPQGSLAIHNLAILFHTAALDLEHIALANQRSDNQRQQLASYWREAYAHWEKLLDDERFWVRLGKRIRELEDPRLTADAARLMRLTLPLALLSINSQLATRAAERGHADEAKRHARLVQESGFDEEAIEEAMRRSALPIRERIKTLCQTAEPESESEPQRGDELARRVLKESRPLTDMLDGLFQPGYTLRDDAHDQVALTALQCEIHYGNETGNWDAPLEVLEQLQSGTISSSVRERLELNLTTARGNVEGQVYYKCWFCKQNDGDEDASAVVKMYGEVNRTWVGTGTRITWKNLTLKIPRCRSCKAVHTRTASLQVNGGCIGVLVGLVAVALMFVYIGVFWAALDWATALAGIFVIVCLGGVGYSIGNTVAKSSSPREVLPEDDKLQYITIKEKKAEGWVVGEKPG